jgi:hypothetical protein
MKVELEKRIKHLDVSAEEWDLYTNRYPEGSDIAAKAMNERFVHLVNSGFPRGDVEILMQNVMTKHARYGAADSEPQAMLQILLNRVFGD